MPRSGQRPSWGSAGRCGVRRKTTSSSASRGRNATLSAVDPLIFGQRARHIPEEHEDGIFPLAQEYDSAVSGFLRETLLSRLQTTDRAMLARAMEVFMGMKAPHAWPIKMPELQRLGLPAQAATPEWARFVDMYRHRLAPR